MRFSHSLFFTLSVSVAFLASFAVCDYVNDIDWQSFKATYSKSYSTPAEETTRHALFTTRYNSIKKLNDDAGGATTFGMYKDMDLTDAELSQKFGLNLEKEEHTRASVPYVNFKDIHTKFSDVPANLASFERKSSFPAAKNQGGCGSCWAFCATGMAESAYSRGTGKVVAFAESDLVDCYANGKGCNGGNQYGGMDYIAQNGFVLSESYPYLADYRNCTPSPHHFPGKTFRTNIDQTGTGMTRNELVKKYIYNVGPVAISIAAGNSAFSGYKSGILLNSSAYDICNAKGTDHAVIMVGFGYNSTINKPYWIIRNSWGTWYGESGYIRLEMGTNLCFAETSGKGGMEYNSCFGSSNSKSACEANPLCRYCPTGGYCIPYTFSASSCPAAAKNCTSPGVCCDATTNKLKPTYTVCRPKAGPCDVEEYCDGINSNCPADKVEEKDLICRDAYVSTDGSLSCDIADRCDGISPQCPPNSYKDSTVQCRAAYVSTNSKVLSCDVAEFCTGNSPVCPPNSFKPSTLICRNQSAVACDKPEYCTGAAAVCPEDIYHPVGTPCNDTKSITINDQCNYLGQCIGQYNGSCSSNSTCNDGNPCTLDICDTKLKKCNYTLPSNYYSILCRNPINGVNCDAPDYCSGVVGVCGEDRLNSTCLHSSPPAETSQTAAVSGGAVAGIVIGVLVVCGLAVAVVVMYKKRIIRKTSGGIGYRFVWKN